MPIDFDIFLPTFAISDFQKKVSSKITPRNNVSFTRSMIQSTDVLWRISRWMSSDCLGLNIINSLFFLVVKNTLKIHQWYCCNNNLTYRKSAISGKAKGDRSRKKLQHRYDKKLLRAALRNFRESSVTRQNIGFLFISSK